MSGEIISRLPFAVFRSPLFTLRSVLGDDALANLHERTDKALLKKLLHTFLLLNVIHFDLTRIETAERAREAFLTAGLFSGD